MICRQCTSDTKVVHSRRAAGSIKRRRECLACGDKFWTIETPEDNEDTCPNNKVPTNDSRDTVSREKMASILRMALDELQ